MVLKVTSMGTTQEMAVLINPKCGCVASVQAVEDATDPQARKKKKKIQKECGVPHTSRDYGPLIFFNKENQTGIYHQKEK